MRTTPKRSFRLIDEYARKHYQCFLAEMFLNQDESEYILCFRPTHSSLNSDRYACRYLNFEVGEVRRLEKGEELGDSVKAALDQELTHLRSSS